MIVKKYEESCKILDISIEVSKDSDETKKIYRKLVLEHHPDKGGDEKIFKEINDAYDFINKNRDSYARLKKEEEEKFEYVINDFEEYIMSTNVFSSSKRLRKRMSVDVTIQMELTVKQIDEGFTNTIHYSRRVTCDYCNGHKCSMCRHTGIVTEDVILEVLINSDVVTHEATLLYPGYGDKIKNLPIGNLIIEPIFTDKFYLKKSETGGLPVVMSTEPVNVHDGGEVVRFDTIDGKVDVRLPNKISDGQIIRLKGKGLTFANFSKKGDHHIILQFI
jgi:DnaJ-class molecular chaperone